eukprot:Phypoly_transcript_12385.p1 GENE.Phypoly_transcript_12385~~Phypoly_transcript_12385.p1  ORF type:complete len:311 (-),score=38.16 Phypoly_transcript_12385:179-1111(-)
MEAIVPFTFYHTKTHNNIAGITYIPASSRSTASSRYKNNTPFHFVFSHATGFCKEVYVDLVVELRSRGITSPITSIDHANHGDSTKHLPCDGNLLAQDLYAVIESVIRPNDPNKILIAVGHSMGGTVAALVEISHPKTFGCLVLMEPILPPPPYGRIEKSKLAEMTLRRKSFFPDKESVRSAFSTKFPFNMWTKGSLESYVEHGFRPSVVDGKEVVELKALKELEAEFYRMANTHGGYDLVPQISVPFLILKGTKSTETSTYDVLIAKCKYGHYDEISGGSHFFPMETPNLAADKTLTFIKNHLQLFSKL